MFLQSANHRKLNSFIIVQGKVAFRIKYFQLAYCNVSIVDDALYESSEGFSVKLANAMSDGWYGARVGENNEVYVTITNDEDGKLTNIL